jgi:hypothetical protein
MYCVRFGLSCLLALALCVGLAFREAVRAQALGVESDKWMSLSTRPGTIIRLPALSDVECIKRLPPPTRASTQSCVADAESVELKFAAGAVEADLPEGWRFRQFPYGREKRCMLFLPNGRSQDGRTPVAMWMTYHAVARTAEAPESELTRWIQVRRALATGSYSTVCEARWMRIDGWPAVSQDFAIAASTETCGLIGLHVLVRTDWGILEALAVAPAGDWNVVGPGFNELLGLVRLQAPLVDSETITSAAQLAAPILGVWRTERGTLRLRGSAQLEFTSDERSPADVGLALPVHARQCGNRVAGHFTAQSNRLVVIWEDGSLVNFRWKTQQDELMLIDQDGRVSQLKRLLE